MRPVLTDERAVLGRIGGQFVKHQAHRQRRVRGEQNRGSARSNSDCASVTNGCSWVRTSSCNCTSCQPSRDSSS